MARILVIDDSSEVRMTIDAILADDRHDVFMCGDGKAGLRSFADSEFDLVITDILMPELDGFEVLKAIKRTRPNQRVLMMTGGGHTMPKGLGLQIGEAMGADALLNKPFMPDELLDCVNQLIARDAPPAAPEPMARARRAG